MSNTPSKPTSAVARRDDERFMEFVPYGSQDKIKLSLAIVKNMVCVPTKSGKLCSDRDAMRFMMKCQAMRLNPFDEDVFLVGYDGKDGPAFSLITAHKAFIKRAELHPEYDGMESGIIIQEKGGALVEQPGDFHLPDQKVVGGWAKVHFKSRHHPMYKRLSITQRKPSYPSQFWGKDKEAEQIVKCAEADALRASFPTLCGGLYLQAEMHPAEPELKPISTPIFSDPSVNPEPEPKRKAKGEKANPEPKAVSMLDRLKALIADANLTEAQVLTFMQDRGIVAEDIESIDAVFEKDPLAISMVVEQWSDVNADLNPPANEE